MKRPPVLRRPAEGGLCLKGFIASGLSFTILFFMARRFVYPLGFRCDAPFIVPIAVEHQSKVVRICACAPLGLWVGIFACVFCFLFNGE